MRCFFKIIPLLGVSLLLNSVVGFSQEYEETASTSRDYETKYTNILNGAGQAIEQGIEQISDKANTTNSPDERNIQGFVISSEVTTFREIPQRIDQDIQAIRARIRLIIMMAATDIEQAGESGQVSLDEGELNYLPRDAREKYERLMAAKKKNNISVRSINLAIKMLSNLNNQLIEAAQNEIQIDRRNRLFITQAAFVYEMADIVLDVLNEIGLEGKADIVALHTDYTNKITRRNRDIESELSRIDSSKNSGVITEVYANQLTEGYQHMQRANEIGLESWNTVMAKVNQQDSWLNDMKGMTEMIELKRNAAKFQLATLRDIGVLRGIDMIVGNMEELVTNVGSMELLVLDETMVRHLIFGDPRLEGTDR